MNNDIHDTLYKWSIAESPADLAHLVLGDGNDIKSPLTSNKVTKQVSQKIQAFLKDNADQFAKYDLPALHDLKTRISEFANLSSDASSGNYPPSSEKSQKNLEKLKIAVDRAIYLTNNNMEFSNPNLPSDIAGLIYEYSMIECINLAAIGKAPSREIIARSIDSTLKLDPNAFMAFTDELKQRRESNPNLYKIMVATFLRSASIEAQDKFFRNFDLNKDILFFTSLDDEESVAIKTKQIESQIKLGDEFLNLIQDDTCNLHLNYFKHKENIPKIKSTLDKLSKLKDLKIHEGLIARKYGNLNIFTIPNLVSLERLTISYAGLETFEKLANCPNFVNLKYLCLDRIQSKKLFESIWDIGNSSSLSNLQELVLADASITEKELWEISHSTFKHNLRHLGLSDCYLSDETIKTLITDPNLKLEKLDLSNNRDLTDETVHALVKCLTDETVKCSYKNTLQYVNLENCYLITKEAKEMLENILQENRNRAAQEQEGPIMWFPEDEELKR